MGLIYIIHRELERERRHTQRDEGIRSYLARNTEALGGNRAGGRDIETLWNPERLAFTGLQRRWEEEREGRRDAEKCGNPDRLASTGLQRHWEEGDQDSRREGCTDGVGIQRG